MKIFLIVFWIIIALAIGGFLIWRYYADIELAGITNFEECVVAGNPVMESYPRQCQAGGKTFVEDIKVTLTYKDLLKVNNIMPDQVISSPVTIKGEARGNWYFEASFPLEIIDANGKQIVIAPAQAEGEWMTTEYVPFSITLNFNKPSTPTGFIILHKDNPSGEARFDDQFKIPVKFNMDESVYREQCYIGGCSSQICSDQSYVVTTCEYKEEYACYRTAKCERQSNGECGWTQTAELNACLTNLD